MSVEKSSTADLTLLKVSGDLAGTNAEDLRSVASECLAQGQHDYIIDLADAPNCDSAGLETLTWLERECADRLGIVKLCGLSESFTKILEITRLSERFADPDEDL